jgi:hypothetical protein
MRGDIGLHPPPRLEVSDGLDKLPIDMNTQFGDTSRRHVGGPFGAVKPSYIVRGGPVVAISPAKERSDYRCVVGGPAVG